MIRRRSAAPPRKTNRRWHIPPPLVHGSEALEGGAVLEEAGGPLGVILWQALRDVLLWLETAPDERAEIFTAGAGGRWGRLVGAIGGAPPALATLAKVVAQPTQAGEAAVAGACHEVALWAETQRMPRTALAFQQNASLAAPKDASSALEVARLAMQESDYARAEVWLRRAIGLAREARDWRLYARAFARLGDLHRARGSASGAHRFYVRSLRGARRGGMRREQAVALHRLFSLAREAGRTEEAERYGRLAFDGYGGRGADPRLADLARDVGQLWLEQGRFAEARLALEAALPFVQDPAERIRVQDELARAASAAPEVGAEPGWAEELATTLRGLRVPGGG